MELGSFFFFIQSNMLIKLLDNRLVLVLICQILKMIFQLVMLYHSCLLWYLKHVQGAKPYKALMSQMKTLQDYKEICSVLLSHNLQVK